MHVVVSPFQFPDGSQVLSRGPDIVYPEEHEKVALVFTRYRPSISDVLYLILIFGVVIAGHLSTEILTLTFFYILYYGLDPK